MHLFGKAKKKPSATETIGRLRDTLDLLEKREKHLQKKVENELAEAKRNAQKNKRAALFALKKKKVYETQIEKLSGARMTIEIQIGHLEQIAVTKEAIDAMKAGAETMKEVHGNMSIEDVENTMDDIREQMDIANEITEAIAQPVGFGMDFDDDELAAELEELTAQQLDEKLLGADVPAAAPAETVGALPAAPTAQPAQPAKTAAAATAAPADPDEAEFRKLQEEMSFA